MLDWRNQISDWSSFMQTVKESADAFDKNHIKKDDLFKILA